jgi:MFS family permease
MKTPPSLESVSFRHLLYGQTLSSFGDWMATVALMALVLDLTGSATAVGGILALRLLPSVFAGPLATSAVMRWDRRQTMLAMDLTRAALVILIPLISALWWIYTLAFLTEVANLVFLPARDSAIPDLVDERELPAANGLVLVSSYGNIPVGAAAFAGITSLGGFVGDHPFWVVFTLDALTYLASFAYIRTLDIAGTADEDDLGDESSVKAFIRAFRLPLIRAVLPGLSTVMLGAGALFSLGIVYVTEVLGAGPVEFGFLIAIFGVGAAGAVGLVQTREEGVTIHLIRGGVAMMGVVLAVMSLVSTLWVAYSVAVLFGAAASTALVGGISYLQQHLSGKQRLLGFTAFHMILRFGMAVAAIGAGLAADRVHAVDLPLIGVISPTSLVMFAAGVLVVIGATMIREPAVEEAAQERGPV